MIDLIIFSLVIGLVFLLFQLARKPVHLWSSDGMGIHGPGSRKLGWLEKFMARGGDDGVITLSNVIIMRSKKPLNETMVQKALTDLSKRHPSLRMRLGRENGKWTYMKEMEDFKLDCLVCDTKDWQGVMEDEILKIFDAEKGPLWRVRFLPKTSYDDGIEEVYPYQSACVFAFHHIITDGPSYSKLFGEFIDRLHEILDGADPAPLESMSLLPPLDAYIDKLEFNSVSSNLKINFLSVMTSVPFIMKRLMKTFMKSPLLIDKLGAEKDRDPSAVCRTAILPVELTAEQTSELLSACKRHKVTVHSAISTAACVGYCKLACGGEIKDSHVIGAGPTTNVRPFLGCDELTDYHGPYFSGLNVNTEVGPDTDFWEAAVEVNSSVQSQLKAKSFIMMCHILGQLVESDKLWEALTKTGDALPARRNRDLVFTNLGHLKFLNRDESSNVQITARFGCSAEHKQGPVFANNLATFNGKLFWTFVYYPHVTSKKQAQQYVDLTMEALLSQITDEKKY